MGMGQPSGWPQRAGTGPSTPAPNPARADPVGATVLVIAGTAGVAQLFLPWRRAPVVGAAPAGDHGSTTGWQLYRVLRAIPDPGFELSAAMYAVLTIAVGGGALILLALALLLPIDHRPIGVATLMISGLSVLGGCWMLVRARSVFQVGVSGLFGQAQIGWYVFLAAGLIGVIGSLKALARG